MKQPWKLTNSELWKLDDSIGYRNGWSIRLQDARSRIESTYGRSYHKIPEGELTLDEYLECTVAPKTSYSRGYPADVAIEDWHNFNEEYKIV